MSESLSAEYLARITHFMEEGIPFNKYLGLKVGAIRRGFVSLRLPFTDHLIGDPLRPALHGGTISMLADTAGGAAVFSGAEPGDRVSTIDLRIDYLRPGALVELHADATLLRIGNRVGVARIQVWQPSEKPESPDATLHGWTVRGDETDEVPKRLIAEGTGVYSVRRR